MLLLAPQLRLARGGDRAAAKRDLIKGAVTLKVAVQVLEQYRTLVHRTKAVFVPKKLVMNLGSPVARSVRTAQVFEGEPTGSWEREVAAGAGDTLQQIQQIVAGL